MTEEKNELYEKAFKCIFDSFKTDNDIFDRIKIYETQYDFLDFPRTVNVISQDERESHPLLTLDQIAELKTKDHSNIYDFLESETTFQELIKYTIDVKSKQNQVFENLKKAIEGEKGIIEQIKALSRKRVVAIIGKNYELISGVFTYLWLTHPYNGNNPANWLLFKTPIRQYFCSLAGKYIPNRIPFVYGNCNGLDVKEMKEGLYSVQHELENCSKQSKNVRLQGFELRSSALQSFELKKMVFLRDINCNAHIEALNMMVGMIKDGLLPKEDVIVSTDTLPQGFKEQFDVIRLEPEQNTPANTPQKVIPFPTPSGTQWHEVKITLLDNENVSIKIKGNVVKKNYAELGFKDSRTGKPSKLWLYFEGLLSSNGEITNYPTTEKAIIEKNISDLRRMLKRCFAINDDPIPYKKTKDYTGYKTDFLIEGKSYTRDYEESIRKNNKKGIPQKGNRYKNETEDLDNETNIDD